MTNKLGMLCMLCCLIFAFIFAGAQDGYTIHVVQRGENLFRIALAHDISTDELAAINGISNAANIQVGQRLLVPSINVTDETAETLQVHEVQPGDTLSSISEIYSVELPPLLEANGITEVANIAVGQALIIPLNTDTNSVSADTMRSSLIHTVQANETLFKIARQYNSTVNDIANANGITDPTRIYNGQQLIIPDLSAPQLVSALPPPLSQLTLVPQVLTEGKTGYVELTANEEIDIEVSFMSKTLHSIKVDENTHRILIGVPVFTEPGIYPLKLRINRETEAIHELTASIQVMRGPYGSEQINLMEGRDTLLNTNVEDAEQALINNLVSGFTEQLYLESKMSLPAAAAITSGFGTRRSYNGGAFDRFHSGTDFAGVPGTPILAPATGQVVMADTLNIRGNATIIDHGRGIYTGYWHQSEMYVQVGDIVRTGDIIGSIGSTGRVTGAHLHWELWVNGVVVDPMQWVQINYTALE